jgi:hypothetical protein
VSILVLYSNRSTDHLKGPVRATFSANLIGESQVRYIKVKLDTCYATHLIGESQENKSGETLSGRGKNYILGLLAERTY